MIKIYLNEPQLNTLNRLRKILPGAHFVDIVVRSGGESISFEADWLKEVVKEIEPKP